MYVHNVIAQEIGENTEQITFKYLSFEGLKDILEESSAISGQEFVAALNTIINYVEEKLGGCVVPHNLYGAINRNGSYKIIENKGGIWDFVG